jgi:peptidoglycan/LPS O-acetylase OafA/YrhL
MVIWGHSFALVPNSQGEDFVYQLTGFEYSGGLAVKVFFFVSGLLVAHSLLRGATMKGYLIARFFRIWPALVFNVFLLALVIGPLLSTLQPREYFNRSEVAVFIFSNSVTSPLLGSINGIFTTWKLPGLFESHPLQEVNGSLWTIPYEVFCYIALLVVWKTFGRHQKKFLGALVAYLIVAILFEQFAVVDPSRILLLACFFSGALLASWQKTVNLKFMSLAALPVAIALNGTPIGMLAFYILIFAIMLFIARLEPLVKITPKSDYSYGVYLWGWPVQQVLVQLETSSSTLTNQWLSMGVAVLLGALSWHLVEERSIKLGKRISSGFREY